MSKLGFCAIILALYCFRGGEAVGCENIPCEQVCIDTIDSYFCDCWPNYDLTADQHKCRNQKQDATETYYLGCYEDNEEIRDFDFRVWTRTDATVTECIRSCRSRAFKYAGLQGGTDCWCDNSYQRVYNESTACTTACGGTPTEVCGGTLAMSVYVVPIDEKYMGCFYEDDVNREMGHFLWDNTTGQPPAACIDGCSEAGFNFAAMYDGGDCYCGDAYGTYGHADELHECNVPCYDNGYSSSNCGGNSTNAIYRVERGNDVAIPFKPNERYGTFYFADYLYDYPHIQGILNNWVMTYSSSVINIPSEDTGCFSENCYGLCGNIAPPYGYDTLNQQDMTIRDFHIKLTEVYPKYIAGKNYLPQRVYIYCQTLVIDGSVNFNFSVAIRARQIIIDYAVNPAITFDHNGPALGIDIEQAITYGPPSDLAFQKVSVLCARLLMGTEDETFNRLGLSIIEDIMTDRAYSEEQQHYIDFVSTVRSNASSIGRNDLHFGPYYSKNYYTTTLDSYGGVVEEYANQYEALINAYAECETFKFHSNELLGIWIGSVMLKSEVLYEDAKDALEISEEAYLEIADEYEESRRELAQAAVQFLKGLIEWAVEKVKNVMRRLVFVVMRMVTGISPCRSSGLLDGIQEVIGVVKSLILLEKTMEDLAKTMWELRIFMFNANRIIARENYDRYMDNVEAVAALYPMIVEWDNFKHQINVIFAEEDFNAIPGAVEFEFALIDTCNWGQALTKALTEYAGMIREYVKYDSIHQANQDMYDRYMEYYNDLGQECENKGRMALAFYEQNYDMMLSANELLIQFCESHFYELLEYCPDRALPKFDADLRNLVQQIAAALTETQQYNRRSSASITIDIFDPSNVTANCTDFTICPVKVLRETGNFTYTMPLTERRLDGIDLFLISEIVIKFPGVESTNENTDFRIDVSKQGPFLNRVQNDVYTFYTRGLSSMKYQYDIVTGATELSCNLVEEGGASGYMIQQAAPFTTWSFKVDEYSKDYIDVSKVTHVELTLSGSYLNLMEEEQH